MSPQLVALLMCVILEKLVRIPSDIQPGEKEENNLDVHICSIFDQYLLFTNYSSQKQRKPWFFYSCGNCLAGYTCCYALLAHPAPLGGETSEFVEKLPCLEWIFLHFCKIVYICLFSIASLPLYSTDNIRRGVLTACMGAVSLFMNWLCGKHLFSAQLHLLVHIHCFQWCSAKERKENKPQQICHACWLSQCLSAPLVQ